MADLDQLMSAYHGAVPHPVPRIPAQRAPEPVRPVAGVATFGPWADHNEGPCGCPWCR